jgi:molybdenum cofactor cytidylyltransferase
MSGTTAAIVLAAGASRRLGSPKQLVDLDGRPLLQHVVAMVAGWPVDGIVVVLGSGAEEILDTVDFGEATIVINEDWDEGMASSIRVGLDLLSREPTWERAFVVLGDQPGIPDEVPPALLAAADEAHQPALVPVYRYEQGHPVLFDRALWPRLMALDGDVGASGLLKTHPEWVREVRFSIRLPRDVDTRADVADLRGGPAHRPRRTR